MCKYDRSLLMCSGKWQEVTKWYLPLVYYLSHTDFMDGSMFFFFYYHYRIVPYYVDSLIYCFIIWAGAKCFLFNTKLLSIVVLHCWRVEQWITFTRPWEIWRTDPLNRYKIPVCYKSVMNTCFFLHNVFSVSLWFLLLFYMSNVWNLKLQRLLLRQNRKPH